MSYFLDTNVLLYAYTSDPRKAVSFALISRPFHISVQTLNEFSNVGRRKLLLDWDTIQSRLTTVRARAEAIHPVTIETHARGLHLAERYQLSVYDGLQLAAALIAGVGLFLSEDMHNGLIVEGRLEILNPFV